MKSLLRTTLIALLYLLVFLLFNTKTEETKFIYFNF